ncbi:MAG: hypothetical protein LBK07_11770, partial [Tannerella sp.]|nr:hypothetical protein [Tannerella sp.]
MCQTGAAKIHYFPGMCNGFPASFFHENMFEERPAQKYEPEMSTGKSSATCGKVFVRAESLPEFPTRFPRVRKVSRNFRQGFRTRGKSPGISDKVSARAESPSEFPARFPHEGRVCRTVRDGTGIGHFETGFPNPEIYPIVQIIYPKLQGRDGDMPDICRRHEK